MLVNQLFGALSPVNHNGLPSGLIDNDGDGDGYTDDDDDDYTASRFALRFDSSFMAVWFNSKSSSHIKETWCFSSFLKTNKQIKKESNKNYT